MKEYLNLGFKMKQEILKTKEDALILAKEWAKKESFVSVIQSRGEFFVENKSNMIRN